MEIFAPRRRYLRSANCLYRCWSGGWRWPLVSTCQFRSVVISSVAFAFSFVPCSMLFCDRCLTWNVLVSNSQLSIQCFSLVTSVKKSLLFFNKSNDRSKQVDRYSPLVLSIKTRVRITSDWSSHAGKCYFFLFDSWPLFKANVDRRLANIDWIDI